MDQSRSTLAARSQVQQKRTDIAVISAMGLVAIAISVALSLHFGLSMSRAGIAGVLIFALFAGAHFLLVPRADASQDVAALEDEELWRALKEQRRNAPDAKRMAMATRGEVEEPQREPAPVATAPDAGEPTLQSQPTEQAQTPSAQDTEGTSEETARHVPRRKPRIIPKAPAANETSQPETVLAETSAPVQAQVDASANGAHGGVSGSENFWSYRPSNDAVGIEPGHETPIVQDPVLDMPTPTARAPEGEQTSKRPSESDVELVQSMIKKLAHQVNAREVLEQDVPLAETHPVADADQARTPELQAMQPPELPSQDASLASEAQVADQPQVIARSASPHASRPAPPSTPAAVDLVTASVGALRETADAMREADEASPDDAPQFNQPVRPTAPRNAGQVASAISSALATGQVGVLLEPIVALNGMRPDHYEVSLQISSPGAADLESADVENTLQATAVLPEVDRERFIKTISVGELLRDRGKAGSLLTRIYRESLLDRDFCFAVATSGVANEELARHMVLTLSQNAVRALTASEWQTLSEFHELGYRFALSHVTDLDMDFAPLTGAGFSFVKLSAKAFLEGFLDGDGSISPQELSRYLAQVGLTVIVEGLTDSVQSADALAMGVSLGQGPVTGGPRLLKSEAVVRDDHAVA